MPAPDRSHFPPPWPAQQVQVKNCCAVGMCATYGALVSVKNQTFLQGNPTRSVTFYNFISAIRHIGSKNVQLNNNLS